MARNEDLSWSERELAREKKAAAKERESEGLGRNDPNRDMERSDIRPGFLADHDKKKERDERRNGAAGDLKGAEENAAGGADNEEKGGGLSSVANRESSGGGLFTGVGKGKGGKGKGKGKGFLKRKGPMGLIIGLILGVGGLMGGSQMLMPFSLVANFTETFNSMHISTKTRAASFFRYQMDSGRVKNPIKGRIFRTDTFKITKTQANRLAAQGIEYDDDYDGARVLKFDDGSGNIKIVTADAATATRIGGDAVDFDTLYKTNSDFYNGYNKGSMTWRGNIANWFDTMTVKFLQSNKITRNLFKNFQEEVKARNDGNTKAAALDLMAKGTEDIKDGGYKSTGVDETETDEEGNKTTSRVKEEDVIPGENGKGNSNKNNNRERYTSVDDSDTGGGNVTRESLSTEAGVRAKLDSIAGTVQKGANIACTVFNVMGGISLLVTASEALQIINLVTSYFEAIDKVKAGDGDDSPINDLSNALTEKKTNIHTDLVSTGTWDSTDENSNFKNDGKDGMTTLGKEETSTTKSAMEASGITALYSGSAVDSNDPSVKSFNFTGSIKRVFGGLGTSLKLFDSCAIAKIAANMTSMIADAVEVAGCLLGLVGAAFTFGASSTACAGLVWGIVKGVALSVAIGITVAGVISAITPVVARMLTRDLISDIGGEDLGNALASGANMYMGNTHRANGGSLANREKYVAYLITQQEVIADDARYERQNKSPFDPSSKYTFFGTLANNMMSMLSSGSAMSTITSASSVLSSSIASLNPVATAYSIAETLPTEEEYEKTCPFLASIGAIGDAYCNPYAITDMSTINYDPADVIDKLSDNFLDEDASDGNVKIDPKSDLAKYILYCDNRTSAYGIVDQNIVNAVSSWGQVDTGNSFVNNMSNSAIGAIPVIGDVIDVVDNMDGYNNSGYISGESCVAGNTVSKAESPNWEKSKYYQRFIEDQSLAETIGLFGDDGKSAVSVFLDEYYEENPLDNSYEGILARYSGLTKDTVVALLDFVDCSNYIAEYDASERYAFGAPVVKEPAEELNLESENLMAGAYILINDIMYADVRNRVNLV